MIKEKAFVAFYVAIILYVCGYLLLTVIISPLDVTIQILCQVEILLSTYIIE